MPRTADAIRRQMREVRRELGDDVQELAESTRDLVDLRCYVRRYPWTSLAVGAIAGYLLVPQRKDSVSAGGESSPPSDGNGHTVARSHTSSSGGGFGETALRLLLNAAIRGAASFVTDQLTKSTSDSTAPSPNQASVLKGQTSGGSEQ